MLPPGKQNLFKVSKKKKKKKKKTAVVQMLGLKIHLCLCIYRQIA